MNTKNFLILAIAFMLSSSAFAFGGSGKGRVSTQYKTGVDAIGIHYGGKDQAVIHDCDAGQGWNGEKCVPVSKLYTLGGTWDTHYNLAANGPNCPENYHWASLNEIITDFNCTEDNIRAGYTCDIFVNTGGWLNDCIDWLNTTISCDDEEATIAYTIDYSYEIGFVNRDYPAPAACRHD